MATFRNANYSILGTKAWTMRRSWLVMDGLRTGLAAQNLAGRHPMDVLNGARLLLLFSFLKNSTYSFICWLDAHFSLSLSCLMDIFSSRCLIQE